MKCPEGRSNQGKCILILDQVKYGNVITVVAQIIFYEIVP